MRQFIYTILMITLCAYFGYYIYSKEAQKSRLLEEASKIERPFFYAENIFNTSYNMEGFRNYTIESPRADYYDENSETKFKDPIMWTFDETGVDTKWRFRANNGILNNDILILTGHVRGYNLASDSNNEVIATEQLFINTKTNDYWSNVPTQLTGEGYQNEGQTVTGNTQSDEITLIKQARGRYDKKSTQFN